MANEKVYTAKEAAFAVLAKAQELLAKSELVKSNPDAKQDAELGEAVEGLCERHMLENKDAERKEGHKLVKMEKCSMCKSMHKAETGHEKGINTQSDPAQRSRVMMGTSKAGSQMPLSRDAATRHEDKRDAVKEHKKVLGEMHAMPKPNLPKSENPDENEIGTKFVKAENKEAPSTDKNAPKEEQAPQRDAKNFETQPGKSDKPADARQAPQAAPAANPKEQAEGNNPPSGAVPGKGLHKLAFFMGHTHHKRKMKKGIALG